MDLSSAHQPTLADLAKELRLSRSTVSRALRGLACISKETRERVRRAAETLGYQRNPYVSALMQTLKQRRHPSHQGTLAIVDTLPSPKAWRQIGVHRHFHEGAVAKARRLGFTVERHWCGQARRESEVNRLTQVLEARGILGLLLPPLYDSGEEEPFLPVHYERFCCVTLGCRLSQPPLCFATNDQYASARLAVRSLYQRGYRRIGLVLPEHTNRITQGLFVHGLRSEAEELRCFAGKGSVLIHGQGHPSFPAQLGRWLKDFRPDAVLGFQPEILQLLENIGWPVPEKVGAAFLDLDWDIEGLSGIDQNSHLVASAAVDLLVDLVFRREIGAAPQPFGVVVEGFWRDGPTAPPRNG